jgi:hypothetical protein
MPRLLSVSGIEFVMYTRDHPPPHVHVFYAGNEYVLELNNINFLRNEPPPKVRRIILGSARANQKAWIEKFNTFNGAYGSR